MPSKMRLWLRQNKRNILSEQFASEDHYVLGLYTTHPGIGFTSGIIPSADPAAKLLTPKQIDVLRKQLIRKAKRARCPNGCHCTHPYPLNAHNSSERQELQRNNFDPDYVDDEEATRRGLL
jgi:hypothetical protein